MIITASIFVALSLALQTSYQIPEERTVPDSSEVYTVVSRISANAMSPYCPGLTVANCPSPQAAVLQDSIKSLVVAGWTPAMIESWLVDRFGEEVRGRPSWRGLGLVGWTLPFVVLVAGALALVLLLSSRKPRIDRPGDEMNPQISALIDQEMAKLKL